MSTFMYRQYTSCSLPQILLALTSIAVLASEERLVRAASGEHGSAVTGSGAHSVSDQLAPRPPSAVGVAGANAIVGREVVKFDFAWRFKLTYQSWQPKYPPSVLPNASEASTDFDDARWEVVDAPHDFLIGLQYNRTGDETEGAFLPRGEGWYRKHFRLPSEYRGRSVWLYFEGVWQQTLMWLNGVPVESGNHTNGYTSFAVRLDDQSNVNFGDSANVLAVHVNALKGSGWWYEGGGIYRHVNLVSAPLLHFSPDGVFAPATVLSPVSNGQAAKASIDARATVNNEGAGPEAHFAVRFDVFDATGKKVATAQTNSSSLAPGRLNTVSVPIEVSPANLWSTHRPYLYTVKATIVSDGSEGDSVNETIGIYAAEWTADRGFYLNDEHFKFVAGLVLSRTEISCQLARCFWQSWPDYFLKTRIVAFESGDQGEI